MRYILLVVFFSVTACAKPAIVVEKPALYQSLTQAQLDVETARMMISSYRQNKGLGALSIDADLQKIAQHQANAMAYEQQPASSALVQKQVMASGFGFEGANLSAGYHTLAEAFSGWRDSASHNLVMLNTKAQRMGMAAAYSPSSKYKVYWVLVVAR